MSLSKKPHENICELLGLDPINDRAKGKEINYAIIYGMHLDNLTNLICKQFPFLNIIKVWTIITNYELYIKSQELFIKLKEHITFCEVKQFIQNEFNRCIKIEKEHALLNNYISSTAADFLYCKINNIINLFKEKKLSQKNKILLQNHDSLLIQLENSVILNTTISKEIDYIMRDKSINNLCSDVDLKTGLDWGNMS